MIRPSQSFLMNFDRISKRLLFLQVGDSHGLQELQRLSQSPVYLRDQIAQPRLPFHAFGTNVHRVLLINHQARRWNHILSCFFDAPVFVMAD